MDYANYHPIPQPEEVNFRHGEKAMGAYMMMLASNMVGLPFPIITLLLSYLYYRGVDKRMRFVRFHALQSLLSQIPITILNSALIFLFVRSVFWDMEWTTIMTGFFFAVLIFNVLYFIFSFIAAFRARKGRFYYFLFFGSLAFDQAYKIRPEDEFQDEWAGRLNRPPNL